jgi:hypothetical protein
LKKDEIIQLHIFLLNLRFELEKIMPNTDQEIYTVYDEMGINPANLSRPLEDHKKAVHILSDCISKQLQNNII